MMTFDAGNLISAPLLLAIEQTTRTSRCTGNRLKRYGNRSKERRNQELNVSHRIRPSAWQDAGRQLRQQRNWRGVLVVHLHQW